MFSVTKKMKFEACHRLSLPYESGCTNLHGHSYKVEVTVECDELNKEGFIIDFTHLKPIQKWLDNNWDHATIISTHDNDVDSIKKICGKHYMFDYTNVSAEFMCAHLHRETVEIISREFIDREFNVKIKIYETANNFAEYRL